MLKRRSLLAIPPALAIPAALGPVAVGTSGGDPVLDPLSPGHAILRRRGQGDGLILPAERARIVGRMTLAGHDLTATAFAADPDAATTIDLLAITSLDGAAPPRLIALEVLVYADAGGTRLATTAAATSDGSRMVFTRAASATRSPTLVARSTWKDYLAWSADGAPLADAPIHPPPDPSCAAILALRRSRVRVALTGDVAEITPALLNDTFLLRPLRL